MSGVVAVCVASLVGVLVLATLAMTRTAPTRAGDISGWRARVVTVLDCSVAQMGRITTAAAVLVAGFGLVILVFWPLGELAHALEDPVDWPVFRWFQARQGSAGWHSFWALYTQAGNRPLTQTLTWVGAILLTLLWLAQRRKHWWIPLILLPIGYLFEKLGQMVLKVVVDRGHPPTTHGTWISGGCARLLVVFGLILFLLMWRRVHNRRVWVAGWSLLAFLAVAEAYSRTYLLKHWVTDVFGGLLYGTVVLLVVIGAIAVLDRRLPIRPSPESRRDEDGAERLGVTAADG